MTTTKNKIFIGLLLENCYLLFSGGDELLAGTGENKNLMRRKSTGGRIFPCGGDKQISGWWGDSPQVGKPCYPLHKSKEEKLILQF